MLKYLSGDATTEGGVTKTSLGTITMPANSKALVGAWAYVAAVLTTLEPASGILEMESPDINLQPCQIPLNPCGAVTSGGVQQEIKVWPMTVALKGGERITGYLTLDMALTGNPKARFGLVVEV